MVTAAVGMLALPTPATGLRAALSLALTRLGHMPASVLYI